MRSSYQGVRIPPSAGPKSSKPYRQAEIGRHGSRASRRRIQARSVILPTFLDISSATFPISRPHLQAFREDFCDEATIFLGELRIEVVMSKDLLDKATLANRK